MVDKPRILSCSAKITDLKTLTTEEFTEFYSEIQECQALINKERTKALLTKTKEETPMPEGECIICQNDKENTVLSCSVLNIFLHSRKKNNSTHSVKNA